MQALLAWAILLVAGLAGASASCGDEVVAPPPGALRVMTYNIHYGDPDLSKITEVICSSGADVIALQEVDVHFSERSGFADQASEIAKACGMEFRYGPIYDLPPLEPGKPNRQFGPAILTRYPVVSWKNHLLTRLSTQADAPPTPMTGFLQVTVDVDGTAVDVFSTHLDFRRDPAVRKTQVAEMLAILGTPSRPTVLMGDMNAPPDREELAPLFAKLRDAWAGHTDPGLTGPSDAPTGRIDYVFLAGPIRASSAHVLDTTASDHRPVVADLVFEGR
ncbi:MAG: endonuclease/exonuclease/phosphatase family protein [Longimicrobiales bacterium]|nr:endonuclease/exonuclease/phosphatase family protein [Longimicrobiales bacterium]